MTCAPPKTYQNQKSFWIPSKQPPNTCRAGWATFFHQKMFSWDTLMYMWVYIFSSGFCGPSLLTEEACSAEGWHGLPRMVWPPSSPTFASQLLIYTFSPDTVDSQVNDTEQRYHRPPHPQFHGCEQWGLCFYVFCASYHMRKRGCSKTKGYGLVCQYVSAVSATTTKHSLTKRINMG